MIVALGESILATGAGFSTSAHWDIPTFIALFVALAGSLAMWWVYFDTGSEHGTQAIVHADDPGRIGAQFHYIHVTLIAGIIVAAVADELMIHHPDQRIDLGSAWVGGLTTLTLIVVAVWQSRHAARPPQRHGRASMS